MKKNKKIIFLFAIIFFAVLVVISKNNLFRDKTVGESGSGEKNPQSAGSDSQVDEDDSLTPEEVIKQLEGGDTLGDNLQLAIVSPEEEVFMPGQARLWRAEFSNIETDDYFTAECKWSFYLNENNEEVLYKEQEISSGVSKNSPQVCGFTSTFIEKRGELRAVLDVKITKSSGEIIGEHQAERTYRVN
jgi:hypothetical protein